MCYKLIRTIEELEAIKLNKELPLFADTETCEELGKTTPKGGLYGKVRLLQIYQKGWKKALLIDCYFIPLALVLEKIKAFRHVYHNATYDLSTINCHTTETWLPVEVEDTFYMSKDKYPEKQKFGFYECLNHAGLEDETIKGIDKKANQTADWSKQLTTTMLKYAAYDVLYLSLLWEKVKDARSESYTLDIANLKYAIHYDRKGLPMNRETIAEIRIEQMLKLEKAQEFVPVNINSPKQCKEWLGLNSTDADTLAHEALRGNEKAGHLKRARQAYKILGFIDKYDRPVMKAFHNAAGARTGRFTCSGGHRYGYDNLQNPPRAIYKAMEAPKGYKLVYSDYSGLELRLVAAYIDETKLVELFKQGVDVHTKTGAFLFDCNEEDLPEQQRWAGKMCSFVSIYGGGAATIAGIMEKQGSAKVDLKEVIEMKRKWLEFYPVIKEWHRMSGKMMQVYGYIDTMSLLGRSIRATTFMEAHNYPIQAAGAEVIKKALEYLHSYDEDPDVANVVHDAITLIKKEGPEAELWGTRLNESMLKGWDYVIARSAVPSMPMVCDVVVSSVQGVTDGNDNYNYGVSTL